MATDSWTLVTLAPATSAAGGNPLVSHVAGLEHSVADDMGGRVWVLLLFRAVWMGGRMVREGSEGAVRRGGRLTEVSVVSWAPIRPSPWGCSMRDRALSSTAPLPVPPRGKPGGMPAMSSTGRLADEVVMCGCGPRVWMCGRRHGTPATPLTGWSVMYGSRTTASVMCRSCVPPVHLGCVPPRTSAVAGS